MPHKTIFVADPGIDSAFAIALALLDPEIELLGLAATAGNVSAERATRNAHILIEQLDPPRWPRLGAALPVEYDLNAVDLHGPDGLGGIDFPCVTLHHMHPSDKLISDLVRQHPKEVTVVLMGPATVLARAFDRDPEVAALVHRLIVVGGTWHEPGDAGPASEFHFACDPPAARQVLRCGAPVTLIPLDISRKFIYSPADMRQLPGEETNTGRFLRQILPHALAPTAGRYGIEGVYLNDLFGLVALSKPTALTTRPIAVDVELRGDLTRGMSVFDARWSGAAKPNVELVTDVDMAAVREYVQTTLDRASGG